MKIVLRVELIGVLSALPVQCTFSAKGVPSRRILGHRPRNSVAAKMSAEGANQFS
jgi:hypothetical protein